MDPNLKKKKNEELNEDEIVELPVSYFSRHLNPAQQRYSATELEAYAVVIATQHYYHYLVGAPFTLYTDHMA